LVRWRFAMALVGIEPGNAMQVICWKLERRRLQSLTAAIQRQSRRQ
jgi:hypothetical protein